eukprot:CAMPEP_0185754106 /NCGR_PEP_ID=MMETSP1174-20130828/12760_1 /TAXON_ID=35687 /ORGANISM="Dictyocha speculum, Strain CCMP1381" /LENGTH=313 /DNA_ID=CAMNT_0028432183 /DNA_START=42 /DNA_END=983 /DNA_ORIENTATION=+
MCENGWFSESAVMWPGQKMSLQVAPNGILFQERSKYQDILVFESSNYGRVLVLDGVIQLTERDEFAYQEMIVHIPMFAHQNPKHILIVGGGDGGVLREVVRHSCVERIDMCEIDEMVIDCAKKFFTTSTATGYEDPRLNLVYSDAAEFLRAEDHAMYDVIIVDSSDPVGPAESLFKPDFYESMNAALKPGGIICTQGECIWLHLDLIRSVLTSCCDMFPTVEYAYTTIPTYPSGQIGFVLCSSDARFNAVRLPQRAPSPELQALLRYYNPNIHSAAFELPQFAALAVEDARQKAGRPPRVPVPVPKPGRCTIS